ncbi:MAG: nitroreductase family protein [Desulfobacteraceae bacterium]|jgi:nitroreductase
MFLDLVTRRRSIRRFLQKPVAPEAVAQLVEAALRAPSSRGLDPWQFVVVEDRERLASLARSKPHGAAFLKEAPLGIVVCADPQRSDVWVEDAAIATIFLHLAAASLGLGSCWVQIRKRMHSESQSAGAYVADLLGLPAGMEVAAIMAIGYPAEDKAPHPFASLTYDKVHREAYGTPWQTRG